MLERMERPRRQVVRKETIFVVVLEEELLVVNDKVGDLSFKVVFER